jgi:hypothetical protein
MSRAPPPTCLTAPWPRASRRPPPEGPCNQPAPAEATCTATELTCPIRPCEDAAPHDQVGCVGQRAPETDICQSTINWAHATPAATRSGPAATHVFVLHDQDGGTGPRLHNLRWPSHRRPSCWSHPSLCCSQPRRSRTCCHQIRPCRSRPAAPLLLVPRPSTPRVLVSKLVLPPSRPSS